MPKRPAGSVIKAGGGIRGAALARANQRSAGGVGESRSQDWQGWFPPGSPMEPQAPKATTGRAFDFPVGVNLDYTPRQQQGQANISFELLRRLADPAQGGLDLVRLAIETVKAEMKRQEFRIVSRDDKHDDGGDRARAIEFLLRKPDGTTRWRSWLSSILEDHLVIDAPSIYYRLASIAGVRRPVFEQLDGSTITLLLDNSGRTPQPPLPAYQQILHGLPAVDYQTTELGYYVDNPRPGRIYGMSPVEQICTIITIALNRQLSVLNYFTAGSVPDMLVGVPKEWNPKQIAEFQEWWDSVLSGQLAEKRKARFYPGDMKPYETKSEILKNDFDEWIARIVCYAFSLSPESLVKQTNRATAETAKEAATEQGIQPRKLFVKDVIDDGLERIGAGDLQLQWVDDIITDPVERATVAVALRGGTTGSALPIITLAESREMMGLPPAQGDELTELEDAAAPPEPMAAPGAMNPDGTPKKTPAGPNPKDEAAKRRRARGSLPPLPANRKLVRQTERALARVARKVLRAQRRALIAAAKGRVHHTTDVAKADLLPSEADLRDFLGALDGASWDEDLQDEIRAILSRLASERATANMSRFADYIDADYRSLLDQANRIAVAWAQERAGNLITQVSDTTRQAVNELVADAIAEGLTNDQLADRFADAFDFSDARADMIARTETAFAETGGTLAGYRASGVVDGKGWSADDQACDECEAMDGEEVGLDESFSDGSDGPPAHPDCRCAPYPVIDSESDSAD